MAWKSALQLPSEASCHTLEEDTAEEARLACDVAAHQLLGDVAASAAAALASRLEHGRNGFRLLASIALGALCAGNAAAHAAAAAAAAARGAATGLMAAGDMPAGEPPLAAPVAACDLLVILGHIFEAGMLSILDIAALRQLSVAFNVLCNVKCGLDKLPTLDLSYSLDFVATVAAMRRCHPAASGRCSVLKLGHVSADGGTTADGARSSLCPRLSASHPAAGRETRTAANKHHSPSPPAALRARGVHARRRPAASAAAAGAEPLQLSACSRRAPHLLDSHLLHAAGAALSGAVLNREGAVPLFQVPSRWRPPSVKCVATSL